MSIILDALKKSESDQQRQSGPALFEVRVAPPKPRLPVWAIAIAALLVVNMLVVGYLLLRRSSRGDEAAATNAATPPAQTAASASGANGAPQASYRPAPPNYQQPNGAGAPYGQAPNSAPGAGAGQSYSQAADGAAARAGYGQPGYGQAANSQPTNNGPPVGGAGQPYNQAPTGAPPPVAGTGPANGQTAYGQMTSGQTPNGTPPASSAESSSNIAGTRIQGHRDGNGPTLATGARETAGADAPANPDDYAPAAEPESPLFKGHVRRGTETGLVLYQDAALVPGANIPQLRLDLHVYAAKPQDRFALINMHRLHEGDSLPEGVRVEAITPDGVVMSHNGSRFLLPRD